ncbi:hypothetical protein Y032_0042g656 [Ancylostoma ceylanicum]|nr:hypothetical protein Y032_0042g656 [Ancylostoma ceylanicum]
MVDLATLTYISIVVQVVPMILTILIGIWVYRTLKTETVNEIASTTSLLASTQTSITHAEIPFPLVAAIAHLHGISLGEFQKLWMHEKGKRCRKVLEVYKKDRLTTRFIQQFASKYLRHGYVGSEALLSSVISSSTPTLALNSRRSKRPPRTREMPESSHVEKSKTEHEQSAKSSRRSLSGKDKKKKQQNTESGLENSKKIKISRESGSDKKKRNSEADLSRKKKIGDDTHESEAA